MVKSAPVNNAAIGNIAVSPLPSVMKMKHVNGYKYLSYRFEVSKFHNTLNVFLVSWKKLKKRKIQSESTRVKV